MNLFFENILAARGKDINNWLPFLIVAFVIVVNIIKVIARGIKSASQQDGIKNEPARQKKTSKYVSAGGGYKTLEQLREERISQIRATFGIPSPPEESEEEISLSPSPPPVPAPVPQPRPVHKHKPKQAVAPQHPAQSENINTAPNAYSLPNDSPVSVSKILKVSADRAAAGPTVAAAFAATSYAPTSIDAYDFYFSSPQDLRKAILYQEILGKPVSLRD